MPLYIRPGADMTHVRKKRKKKHYFLKFLLFAALCTGLFFLLSSEYFDIQKIRVKGNNNYTKQQVVKMSGIKKGENIFALRARKTRENMKENSYIYDVKIRRSLPDKVVLEIKERKEQAAVPYEDSYIMIDREGYVLKKTKEEPKLTVIQGMTIERMKEGKKMKVKEGIVLEDTLTMLVTMKKSDLFFKKIDISRVIIKAYIYDSLVCEGTPSNIMKIMKNGDLEAVLYDLYQKDIKRGVINIGEDDYCSFSPAIN